MTAVACDVVSRPPTRRWLRIAVAGWLAIGALIALWGSPAGAQSPEDAISVTWTVAPAGPGPGSTFEIDGVVTIDLERVTATDGALAWAVTVGPIGDVTIQTADCGEVDGLTCEAEVDADGADGATVTFAGVVDDDPAGDVIANVTIAGTIDDDLDRDTILFQAATCGTLEAVSGAPAPGRLPVVVATPDGTCDGTAGRIEATIAPATPAPTEAATPAPAPTEEPTATPEPTATVAPTDVPTEASTEEPTATPEPTEPPTREPSPTVEPTATPEPTEPPTVEPTPEPTAQPTDVPTEEPTATTEPTATVAPTETVAPTAAATATADPTAEPTATVVPTATTEPTIQPTDPPTEEPAATTEPTPSPTATTPAETPDAPATETPQPVPAADDDGSDTGLWVGVGSLVVLAVAAGAVLYQRRKLSA